MGLDIKSLIQNQKQGFCNKCKNETDVKSYDIIVPDKNVKIFDDVCLCLECVLDARMKNFRVIER